MEEPDSRKNKKLLQKSKVFDVEKPGKTIPSQNARPVMLSHSSLPHIPVSADDDSNSLGDSVSIQVEDFTQEPDEIKQRSQKSRIEPADDTVIEPDNDEPKNDVNTTNEPDVPEESEGVDDDVAQIEPTKQPKRTGMVIEPPADSTAEASAKIDEPTSDDDIDEINEFAGQAAAKKAKKAEDDAEAKRIAAALELAASKQYVVPISNHKASKAISIIAIILLVVVAVAAGVYWYLMQ